MVVNLGSPRDRLGSYCRREWGSIPAGLGSVISGGEAQRVALARAFVLEPELLLLDEPFASLDTDARSALAGELRRLLAETRTTTVFITHDPAEVRRLATRTVWLEDGRLTDHAPGVEPPS